MIQVLAVTVVDSRQEAQFRQLSCLPLVFENIYQELSHTPVQQARQKLQSAARLMSSVFWDITPYNRWARNRRFGETCRLIFNGLYDFTFPADETLHNHSCGNLRIYIKVQVWLLERGNKYRELGRSWCGTVTMSRVEKAASPSSNQDAECGLKHPSSLTPMF
jgi:hypothetical protein